MEKVKVRKGQSGSGTATEAVTYMLVEDGERCDFLICTLSHQESSSSPEVVAILIEAQHTNLKHAVAQVILQVLSLLLVLVL